MDQDYKCGYCKQPFNLFSDTIFHTVHKHPELSIDILIKKPHNPSKFGHLTFDVIPKEKFSLGLTIIPNDLKRTISFANIDEDLELSPLKKAKTDTISSLPEDIIIKLEKSCQTDDTVVINCSDIDDNSKTFLYEIRNILPDVLSYLGEHNQLQNWTILFHCLANHKLPLDNISYKLFMDVVSWFSIGNSAAMRYDETVRRFWRTGKQLFKGKFIRFMSGLKNAGQVKAGSSVPGEIETSKSEINFIVPSKDLLDDEDIAIRNSTKQPGIIEPLIQKIASKEESKGRPFKLSVDLKKINPGGKFGDVDCFGFEQEPTFVSREERLKIEKVKIQSLSSTDGHDNDVCKDIVQVLSGRVRDLKTLEKKREYAFNKLKQESGPKWKDSRLAFVLSSIQTSLFAIKDTMKDLKTSIRNVLKTVANKNSYLYPEGEIVDLGFQPNYVCLVGMDQKMIDSSHLPISVYCQLVKQRSLPWIKIRSNARITGSTAYKGIGLGTLKAQQEHYDEVFRGKPKVEPTDQQKINMDYGSENEKNAIATLVSVLMPTFFPNFKFFEEGCYVFQHEQTNIGIVSPDGSLRSNSGIVYAVEVKCPNPNNATCQGPYYKPPNRYVLQILMEMYVLKVNKAILVCWMPNTTTIIEMSFSLDLWKIFMDIIFDLYCPDNPTRPSRLHPKVKDLKVEMQKYLEKSCRFLCEVESVQGKYCHHSDQDPHTMEDLRMIHCQNEPSLISTSDMDLENLTYECEKSVSAAYNLSRDYAKQVMVVMLSDFDRIFKPELPHSCPVAYGFTGYSFTTEQAANILKAVRDKCRENGLNIVSQCFDGAFSKMAVRGEDGEPLTLLQLSKDVWARSCSLPKQTIVQQIGNHGKTLNVKTFNDVIERFYVDFKVFGDDTRGTFKGPITIGKSREVSRLYETPPNWKLLVKHNCDSPGMIGRSSILDSLQEINEDNITADVADGIVSSSDNKQDDIAQANEINTAEDDSREEDESLSFDEYEIHSMWSNLTELERRKNLGKDEFIQLLSSPEQLGKLTKNEISRMLKPVNIKLKNKNIRTSMKKNELIHAICGMNSDKQISGSTKKQTKTPRTLQSICKTYIQTKLPKHFLNVVHSAYIFPDELQVWKENASFNDNCLTNYLPGKRYWYSQPKYLRGEVQFLLEFLDPEHLLTNMRSKVCSTGIPKAGISQKAWLEVARNGKANGSNLSLALVENLVDKQNVAFAQKTFSTEVEVAMKSLGFNKEAEFCRLFRNWYRAQDEAGMSHLQRQRYEQELRDWLLNDIRFDTFPPPGKHIKDIPIVLFEGLMISIDRKSQLYAFTGGVYNTRSIGTLDNENMFAAFQDWDSKGTGVLRAEEVPQALYTACDLYQTRLDEKRGFVLHTSAARVYPVPPSLLEGGHMATLSNIGVTKEVIRAMTSIPKRDHIFDMRERRNQNPKRKRGQISNFSEPAKGCIGVRTEWYTLNEAKIFPHVRAGLQLPDTI